MRVQWRVTVLTHEHSIPHCLPFCKFFSVRESSPKHISGFFYSKSRKDSDIRFRISNNSLFFRSLILVFIIRNFIIDFVRLTSRVASKPSFRPSDSDGIFFISNRNSEISSATTWKHNHKLITYTNFQPRGNYELPALSVGGQSFSSSFERPEKCEVKRIYN